jgi:hypothetical protein
MLDWQIVGAWFIGGGAMSSEARPAFVPSEICRFFHATGDTLLHQVNSRIIVQFFVFTLPILEVGMSAHNQSSVASA